MKVQWVWSTMESKPGPVCLAIKFSSSNLLPYILTQPLPSPFTKSPPWIMKSLITRWNVEALNPIGLLFFLHISHKLKLKTWAWHQSKKWGTKSTESKVDWIWSTATKLLSLIGGTWILLCKIAWQIPTKAPCQVYFNNATPSWILIFWMQCKHIKNQHHI